MVRRLFAASFAAATLSVMSMAPAWAQASPPTSESAASSAVEASSAAALPRTGTDVAPTVLLGAGLASAGVGMVVVARRRRAVFARRPRHAISA